MSPEDLSARLETLMRVLNDYWIQWRNNQLRERSHVTRNVGIPRTPIVGEVVVVNDEHYPGSLWKFGRVTELITGNDGQVRGAKVKVITNEKPITLLRPTSSDSKT